MNIHHDRTCDITWLDPTTERIANMRCLVHRCKEKATVRIIGEDGPATITLIMCAVHGKAVLEHPEQWQDVVGGLTVV